MHHLPDATSSVLDSRLHYTESPCPQSIPFRSLPSNSRLRDSRKNPYRFAYQRLGLSESALEDNITQEINASPARNRPHQVSIALLPSLGKPQLRLLHLRFPKTMACTTSNLPEDPPLAHSLESTIGQLILAHQDLISMSILIPIVLVCWMLMTESTSYGFLFVTSPLF